LGTAHRFKKLDDFIYGMRTEQAASTNAGMKQKQRIWNIEVLFAK